MCGRGYIIMNYWFDSRFIGVDVEDIGGNFKFF